MPIEVLVIRMLNGKIKTRAVQVHVIVGGS